MSMSDPAIAAALNGVLSRQRAAQMRDGAPSAAVRAERIGRCIGLLVDHRRQIEDALDADFGGRSRQATAFGDIAASIGPLKHARSHVRRWMRTERRSTTPRLLGFLGGRAEIRHQPKGVVGLISPWNFPVNLTFAPLAGILAAGNRVMIKPSEVDARDLGADEEDVRQRLQRRGDRGGHRRPRRRPRLRAPRLRSSAVHRRDLDRPRT